VSLLDISKKELETLLLSKLKLSFWRGLLGSSQTLLVVEAKNAIALQPSEEESGEL
jgi:hypothetical protein